VANTLGIFRNGAVGFIDLLGDAVCMVSADEQKDENSLRDNDSNGRFNSAITGTQVFLHPF